MLDLATPTLVLAALLGGPGADGEAVIRAAHAKYAGKWHQTMTFVQKTTFPDRPTETWYEAMELPGKLRIDVAPTSSGRTTIFRNDSLYGYNQGTLRGGRPFVHSMLVLLGDMHVLAPEQTIAKLKALGFDLSKSYDTKWNGKDVVVVGATAGDTTSKQFWLEKDRMLVVRLIEPAGQRLMDAHFGKYEKEGDAWVEREILIYMNGKLAQSEEYTQVKTNVKHEPGLFEPVAVSKSPAWVGEGKVVFGS